MSSIATLPVLIWKDFYDKKPLPSFPLAMLEEYELDDIVHVCIWFKNSLEIPGKKQDLNDTLINRLPYLKGKKLKRLLKISDITQPVVIDHLLADVFRSHSLKTGGKDIEKPDFEEAMLDVVLAFNELHYNRQLAKYPADSCEGMWSIALAQGLTGLDNIDYARTANIKHLIFARFLRKYLNENYEKVEKSFFQKTGLESFYSFIHTIAGFYLSIEGNQAKHLILPSFSSEDCLRLASFQMIIDREKLPDPKFEIGLLATKPYYKTGERLYVLSRSHFAFALEKSWPYFLYRNSNLSEFLPGSGTYNDFLSVLGKQYFEEYFLHTMLSSLHKTGFRYISEEAKYMPDGCFVVNETTVILFEFKSSPVHYSVMANQDVPAFKNFLDDNFATSKKGAKQLINAIEYLDKNPLNAFGIKLDTSKLTVYPVIIYSDKNLGQLGVNQYVDQSFQMQLRGLKLNLKQVHPLVMVHSDFFTENLTLLERNRSLLKKALDEFIKYRRKKMAIYYKTKQPADFLAAQMPFDNFINTHNNLYRVPQKTIFMNLVQVFKLRFD